MKIKDLLKKVTQLNKLNDELGFDKKVNLVLEGKYDRPIRIYKNNDLKEISNYYIDELANKILNNELVQADRYEYKITDTEFEVWLEIY